MSKLSEPVAKALQALLERCKGDTTVVMRTIIGNYSATEYFINLKDEINLLRCAPFNDILIALVESLPQAIKTTEQPSKAAAVESLEGILTKEELLSCIDEMSNQITYEGAETLKKISISHHHLLSANAELSFKNLKLREAMRDIVCTDMPDYEEDFTEMKRIANQALEELK